MCRRVPFLRGAINENSLSVFVFCVFLHERHKKKEFMYKSKTFVAPESTVSTTHTHTHTHIHTHTLTHKHTHAYTHTLTHTHTYTHTHIYTHTYTHTH